jgi:hypothetical protein
VGCLNSAAVVVVAMEAAESIVLAGVLSGFGTIITKMREREREREA